MADLTPLPQDVGASLQEQAGRETGGAACLENN